MQNSPPRRIKLERPDALAAIQPALTEEGRSHISKLNDNACSAIRSAIHEHAVIQLRWAEIQFGLEQLASVITDEDLAQRLAPWPPRIDKHWAANIRSTLVETVTRRIRERLKWKPVQSRKDLLADATTIVRVYQAPFTDPAVIANQIIRAHAADAVALLTGRLLKQRFFPRAANRLKLFLAHA